MPTLEQQVVDAMNATHRHRTEREAPHARPGATGAPGGAAPRPRPRREGLAQAMAGEVKGMLCDLERRDRAHLPLPRRAWLAFAGGRRRALASGVAMAIAAALLFCVARACDMAAPRARPRRPARARRLEGEVEELRRACRRFMDSAGS